MRTTNTAKALTCISMTGLLAISGCSKKPWGEPLASADHHNINLHIDLIREKNQNRPSCFDGDLNIFFTSKLHNQAVSGYFQYLHPNYAKFLVQNPFGQPLYGFSSTDSTFQLLNTQTRSITYGEFQDFIQLNNIPQLGKQTDWGTFLTGRLPENIHIEEIRPDSEGNGLWISLVPIQQAECGKSQEHLQIDEKRNLLIGRLFTEEDGGIQARISYDYPAQINDSKTAIQPELITLSELDYGAKITLEFKSIQTMECTSEDFHFPTPKGFVAVPLTTTE